MNKALTVEKSLHVAAPPDEVWEAITTPALIKKYFFGTEVITDWQVDHGIVFQGSFEGKSYRDKGKILRFEPEELLQYTYWSGFSGLEDSEENYSLVTYKLSAEDGGTRVELTQRGFANEAAREHGENGWEMVLKGMKELVEE